MRGYWDTFLVIAQIALRNLFASRLKTLIVGGIILFGAWLVVLGTSLVDSVDASMKRSIVGSVAGDIQVYSSESNEDLDVMGGFSLEGSDVAPVENFEKLREVLLGVENVKSVVPMGLGGAFVASGNTIDLTLAALRDTVRRRRAGERSPELDAVYEAQKSHVRQIVSVLKGDFSNVRELNDARVMSDEDEAVLERAAAAPFWQQFDQDPLDGLEFLENQVAQLATDADLLALRYLGTDPAAFAQSFDRFTIVDGETIPRGKPGFLFSKYVYENEIKLKTARSLDKIHEGRSVRGATIAEDAELQRLVRENGAQVKELLLQLDELKAAEFRTKLQKQLGSQEADVGKLLSSFLTMDDQNFDERYAFFYRELAPSLALYRVPVGSTLTIKAFTKSGYVQSVNLHVYGTFAFQGLEKSPQAGSLNLMDLVSFRQLYGFLTAERAQEIAALRQEMGTEDVARDRVEDELFGAAPTPAEPVAPAAPEPSALEAAALEAAAPEAAAPESGAEGTSGVAERDDVGGGDAQPTELDQALQGLRGARASTRDFERGYDPKNLEQGVVLNAAVLLSDPERLEETRKAIEAAAQERKLPLKVVTWQTASGLTGQFVTLMRLILYVAVLIIFVVALVIISNALVMATLERVREIGTLRALGAQRRFVLAMLVVESVLVGLVFGTVGALAGAGIVVVLSRLGVPAQNDVMTFFFSGSRLYPDLAAGNLLIALGIVFFVSALSCFYPAWIAMRVSPRQAMQAED
jgi:ABC-type lipoprotein release transport system permease subunit